MSRLIQSLPCVMHAGCRRLSTKDGLNLALEEGR